MNKQLYYRKGALLVRLTIEADVEETPLYADAIDTASGTFLRDNRLIEQILQGEYSEPITEVEFSMADRSQLFQSQTAPTLCSASLLRKPRPE